MNDTDTRHNRDEVTGELNEMLGQLQTRTGQGKASCACGSPSGTGRALVADTSTQAAAVGVLPSAASVDDEVTESRSSADTAAALGSDSSCELRSDARAICVGASPAAAAADARGMSLLSQALWPTLDDAALPVGGCCEISCSAAASACSGPVSGAPWLYTPFGPSACWRTGRIGCVTAVGAAAKLAPEAAGEIAALRGDGISCSSDLCACAVLLGPLLVSVPMQTPRHGVTGIWLSKRHARSVNLTVCKASGKQIQLLQR